MARAVAAPKFGFEETRNEADPEIEPKRRQGVRLLVAHDGREGGRDALELARMLAGSMPEASALVVTLLPSGPIPLQFRPLTAAEAEKAGAEPIFAEAREVLSDLEFETRAYGAGSPAGILTLIAEKEPFDMIVVGSPHRGRLGRIVVGSVARSLLSGSPADVAIAPTGYAQAGHDRLKSIAVGYDGSAESRRALDRAGTLAKPAQAKLRLIMVVSVQVVAPVMAPGSVSLLYPEDPDKVLGEGIDSVDPVVEAIPDKRDGDPAAELVEACQDGVDLLVLGSRGYGPMARVLLGSVSHRVTLDATVPVLVVRRPK